jgi:hypothetical protein
LEHLPVIVRDDEDERSSVTSLDLADEMHWAHEMDLLGSRQ